MQQYTIEHLDPLFTRNFGRKLQQYQLLGCLPDNIHAQETVISHALQLLQGIHPKLAIVLDSELEAGNLVRTVCNWSSGALYINLLQPFTQRYMGRRLNFLLVKDHLWGGSEEYHYNQYTTSLAPAQYLTASINQ